MYFCKFMAACFSIIRQTVLLIEAWHWCILCPLVTQFNLMGWHSGRPRFYFSLSLSARRYDAVQQREV